MGQDLTVIGRVRGTAVGGTGVALERQSFPFQSGFSRGREEDREARRHVPVQRQLAVPDHALPRRHAHQDAVASRVYTASSAVKVDATGRSLGRRRARIKGAIWPRVPNGRVQLKKRSPRGSWVVVKRAKAKAFDANRSRYSFTVKRDPQAGRCYRVIVLPNDGGAHVAGRSKQVRVKKLAKKKR